MSSTTATRRILITGTEAAELVRRANRPEYKFWTEIKVMDECRHGCKLYARRRGCITQYELVHYKGYGCDLARNPNTARIPVSVAPKARAQAPAVIADDQLLDRLGSATPGAAGPLGDDDLNNLTLAWRAETEATPIPDLVDVDTALATIQASAL